jgi:hypothetical protein
MYILISCALHPPVEVWVLGVLSQRHALEVQQRRHHALHLHNDNEAKKRSGHDWLLGGGDRNARLCGTAVRLR